MSRPRSVLLLRCSCLMGMLALPWLGPVFRQSQDVAPSHPQDDRAGTLEVMYLANEGFLLRHAQSTLLIDAFLRVAYAGYPALPADVHASLVRSEDPFSSVDLALVSHVHGDHFQDGTARQFLEASPDTLLASSPQVIEALAASDDVTDQIMSLLPEAGKKRRLTHAGIEVEMLRIPHSGAQHSSIQNIAHLIRLGPWKLLHLGDADMQPEHFLPYLLGEEKVDICFVPYWYLMSADGRELIVEHIAPRTQVAVHIPIQDGAAIRAELKKTVPGVVVFDKALQVQRF